MKIFVVLFSLLVTLQSQANCGTDLMLSMSPRPEALQCTMPGYCYAYDFNTETLQYDYTFGFHTNCEGLMHRTNVDYVCQRQDQSVYPTTDIALWSICTL